MNPNPQWGRAPVPTDRAGPAMALMVLACLCFVAANALVKAAGESLPTGEVLFVRGLIACAILWCIAHATQAARRLREAAHPIVLARAAAEALGSTCFLASLHWLPLANATAIDLCAPLIAALLAAWLLHERVGPWRWAAIGLGLAGVLLIVQPGLAGFNAAALLCLAGTVLHALRDLMTRRVPAAVPSVLVAGCAALGLTLVAGAWSLLEGWRTVGGPTLAAMAVSAICLCGGLLAVIASLRRAAVSTVAPLRYASLPLALLVGLLLWGDVPEPWASAGMALVIAAGAMALRAARPGCAPAADRAPRWRALEPTDERRSS